MSILGKLTHSAHYENEIMMSDIVATSFTDTKVAFDDELLPTPRACPLVSQRYTAKYASGGRDYRNLFVSCSKESGEFRSRFLENGYRLYLFFVGPKIESRSARFPRYKLSTQIAEERITILKSTEANYAENDAERSIGLYEIQDSDFADGCYFLSKQPWSILLISIRQLSSALSIDELYRVVINKSNDKAAYYPSQLIDWRSLSSVLCPLGDIVVKTSGRFDDRKRTIAYIHKAQP